MTAHSSSRTRRSGAIVPVSSVRNIFLACVFLSVWSVWLSIRGYAGAGGDYGVLMDNFSINTAHYPVLRNSTLLRSIVDLMLPQPKGPSDKSLSEMWDKLAENTNQTSMKIPLFFQPRDRDHLLLSLVTHLSVNKLDRLETLARWWNGPISAALYCSDRAQADKLDSYLSNKSVTTGLQDLSVHVFLEQNKFAYPHNILRNMALTNAQTKFVLLVDADLVPSPPNTYFKIMQALRQPQAEFQNQTLLDRMEYHNELLVLPVFEIYPSLNSTEISHFAGETELGLASEKDIPQNKTALLQLYQRNIARQWHFPGGHASSNYPKWLSHTTTPHAASYPISPQPNYEPYFIGYREALPSYWEEFRGYGLNKQSFVAECIIKGFSFRGLYSFWVSHLGHPTNRNMKQMGVNKKIWDTRFMKYLHSTYPSKTKTSLNQWFRKPPG